MGDAFNRIYETVKLIPYGTVATYGQVAAYSGNPRWARVVGYALHANPDPENIRCYRVVSKDGSVSEAFAFAAGINSANCWRARASSSCPDGRVDMKNFEFKFV